MPAKWIRVSKTGLEGKVLTYVREPNVDGVHDVIIASASMHGFFELYLQLIGTDTSPEAQALLGFLKEMPDSRGIVSLSTTLDSIQNIKEKYACDIIEVCPQGQAKVLRAAVCTESNQRDAG